MDRTAALNDALDKINSQYGPGSIMELGSDERQQVDVISTGCVAIDIALGVGGVPRGRVVEVYGPESSGKTTLALHIIAEAQKGGQVAAFVDAEHALDPVYAAAIGVNIDKLLVSQPDTGEQALEIVDILVKSGEVALVVIDSVSALTPRAEIEGEMGDSHIGLQARLMSQALRKITGSLHKTNTTCLFINQLRTKIGVIYGSPEVTSGGRALAFYASMRIDVRRISTIKGTGGDTGIGNRSKVKIAKNKLAPPFKIAEFDIMFGEGISREGSSVDMGVEFGIVQKSGAWYKYNDLKLGQGREAAKATLRDNPEVCAEIDKLIYAAAFPKK